MKNSIFTLALVFSLLSAVFTSCETLPDPTEEPEQYGGTYKVYLDNKLVGEGSTKEVGLLADLVTMSNGSEFGIILSDVPVEVGEMVALDEDHSDAGIIINGTGLKFTDDQEEYYFSTSGKITRVSKTKISFEGYCEYAMNDDTLSFSGVIESEAFKMIKEDVY